MRYITPQIEALKTLMRFVEKFLGRNTLNEHWDTTLRLLRDTARPQARPVRYAKVELRDP